MNNKIFAKNIEGAKKLKLIGKNKIYNQVDFAKIFDKIYKKYGLYCSLAIDVENGSVHFYGSIVMVKNNIEIIESLNFYEKDNIEIEPNKHLIFLIDDTDIVVSKKCDVNSPGDMIGFNTEEAAFNYTLSTILFLHEQNLLKPIDL